MERRDLYEDDLTEEREPSPVTREEDAHSMRLDPDEPDPAADDDDGKLFEEIDKGDD